MYIFIQTKKAKNMDWMSYPENRPNGSGTYHISIERPQSGGTFTFHYVAYYDANTNSWYKFDGFDDENKKKELITYRIVGWVNDLGILL